MDERTAHNAPERGAAAILDYHEATKHSETSVRESPHFLDWPNQPLPFKIYRDLDAVPLVRDFPERDEAALAAIARDPAEPVVRRTPDRAALSRLLHLAAGITKVRRHAGGELYFRAHPNTGNLHHIDLYLVTGELPDLAAGIYHFGPHDFSLHRLREGDWRGVLVEASGAHPDLARAPAVVASASTWWRNAWKYRDRAWRHVFWDGGALHANLLAAAATEDLSPRVVLGFADAAVTRLLSLDPGREGPVALVALGCCDRSPPPPPRPELPPLRLETVPLSPEEVDYPAIREAQRASSLPDGRVAADWRSRAIPAELPHASEGAHRGGSGEGAPRPPKRRAGLLHSERLPLAGLFHRAQASPHPPSGPRIPLRPLSDEALPADTLDAVVRRRGSTRAFDPGAALSFEELSTALDRATRGVAADFLAPGASLLELYLLVNAVDGLAPGVYRLRREEGALELLRERDEAEVRRAAARLALGQELAGRAAVNVYHLADLEAVVDRLGARGYRAAQLEGGIVGGRLYLAAYAQRFGATGLTFFDDEVIDFLGPHVAGHGVMFLTALGRADRAALGLAG